MLILLKITWIEPYTGWFRLQSNPDRPLEMQHASLVDFGDGIRLLGYDLQAGNIRQGERLTVRLYWRATQPVGANYRPFVHLDALNGSDTWANSTAYQPARGTKPTSDWVVGYYVVDEHDLLIAPETPAVSARLTVGMIRADNNTRLPVLDGRDQAELASVRVLPGKPLDVQQLAANEQHYDLGPSILLLRADVKSEASGVAVTLYWQARQPLNENYTVFAHLLDGQGQVIAQSDGDPVNGWLPTSNWQPGEVVADTRHIAANLSGESWQVEVGMYRRSDGQRLPVRDSRGQPVPNDRILVK